MSGVSALRLELRPSHRLAVAIVAAHAAAAVCLAVVVTGLAGVVLAALATGLGAAAAWDRALLRGARAVRALELRDDGSGSAESARGERHALARSRGRVGRLGVIIALQKVSRRQVLVTGDMLDAESFRRLRLWALWGRLPGGDSGRAAA